MAYAWSAFRWLAAMAYGRSAFRWLAAMAYGWSAIAARCRSGMDGSESAYLRCGGVDDATKAASPFDGWERISSVGLKQFRRAKAELLINNHSCWLGMPSVLQR